MNPYEVLGVSPTASDEDVRAAYLKLVKKYHPDRYQDSVLKKQAEDKMKQINAAYDTIKEAKKNGDSAYDNSSYGGSSYGGSSYGGSSYGSNYKGEYAAEFAKVRSFLSSSAPEAAAAVLDAIPLHNAEWYFLYGMCYYRSGQFAKAYEFVSRAASMDPNNFEYRSALSSMRGRRSSQSANTSTPNLRYCSLCSTLMLANLCCGLCGRGCGG